MDINEAIEVVECFKDFCDKTNENNKKKQLQALQTLIQTTEAVRDAEVPKKDVIKEMDKDKATFSDALDYMKSQGVNYGIDACHPTLAKKDLEIKALTEEVKVLREENKKLKDLMGYDDVEQIMGRMEGRYTPYDYVKKYLATLQAENKKLRLTEDFPIPEFNLTEAQEKVVIYHEPFRTHELLKLYGKHILTAICSLQKGENE